MEAVSTGLSFLSTYRHQIQVVVRAISHFIWQISWCSDDDGSKTTIKVGSRFDRFIVPAQFLVAH